MGQLTDRIAVITGASMGIGKSIAIAYAAEGAKVVLAARNSEKLKAVAEEIRRAGGTALVVPTNVTIEEETINLFQQALKAFDRVDILVNSAGITSRTPTEELSLGEWKHVLDVNLTGAFLCSREAFKMMKRQRSGRIINIGSISAKVPRPNNAPYTTSKFALEGLTRSLALDGRDYGIAVSILHPGNTMTQLWQGNEDKVQKEGIMSPDVLAQVAVLMAALPQGVNMFEGILLPVSMPFLGRG